MNDVELFRDQLKEAQRLQNAEENLLSQDQLEIPVKHHFAGGIYVREILIPAGSIIMGKRHRHATCNFLVSGELSLYMGEGIPSKRVRGPMIFESHPGTKKLAYSHTDAVFMNFHPTEETDLEIIEKEFIIPEQEYIEEIEKCLGLEQLSAQE